jgi:cell division protein FtsN
MMAMPPSDSSSQQMASAEPAMLPGVQDFQPMLQEPVMVAPAGQPMDMMMASIMPAPEPQAMSAPRALTGIDALRADPRVVVQSLPKEHEAAAKPQPEPQPASPPRGATGIDALRADPRVVVQPLPKERETQPAAAPQPVPASLTPPMPDTKPQSPQKTRVADASATAGGHVYVQAGAFFSEARARQAATGLESMDVKIMTGTVNGREVFRVRIGPFTTVAQAKAAFAQVQARGHNDLIIVKE